MIDNSSLICPWKTKQTNFLKLFEILRRIIYLFPFIIGTTVVSYILLEYKFILADRSKQQEHHTGWFYYLRRCKAQIFPVPRSTSKTAGGGKNLWVKKGGALQTVSFSSSRLVSSRHWDGSTLPPSWSLWRVIWGHSPCNRGQKLLPLLLHQTGCTDDLVAWRPQIRPVHLLS